MVTTQGCDIFAASHPHGIGQTGFIKLALPINKVWTKFFQLRGFITQYIVAIYDWLA
jgi:hypothetical protein